MTNQAKIVITAVDQATATMLKIRAEMRAMTQPMRDIKASMGRFAEGSGLRQMQRDFQKIGHAARAVGGAVTRIVAPMAAIVGVGSIAGLAELSRQWANMGWTIERTAQTLGVAPEKLQALQGAAKLAGLSADDMTNSLGALGNTLQDALYGRNQQAMYALNQLGITIHKTATGAVDSTRALSDLSAVIQRYNGQPQVQQRIADQFGIGSLLPLLRQGPQAIRRFEDQARRLGYVMGGNALHNSTALAQSFVELQMSLIGLRNSISNALFPVLTPMLNNVTQWVAANRQLIAQDVSRWVSEIVQWVRSVDWGAVWRDITGVVAEIRSMASGINDAVQSLGGWKTALELAFGAWALGKVGMFTLAVLRLARAFGAARVAAAALPAAEAATGAAAAAGTAASVATLGLGAGLLLYSPTIGQGEQAALDARQKSLPARQQAALAQLLASGMSPVEASGLVANFTAESALNPSAVGDGGKAYGIGQWHPDRQAQFARLFGLPIQKSNLQQQLAFARWELGNTENGAQQRAAQAKTAADAGSIYSRYYERPANADQEARTRGILAQQIYAQNQMMFRSASSDAPQQKVDITLHVKNAPPGTRVEARRADGDDVPVNVAYNMVGQH